jgi:hypothetical protein
MIPIETPQVVPDSTAISTPNSSRNSTKERAEMRTRMMKPTLQFQSSLAGACSVLLMLCAGQAGLAQQSVQPAKAATVASAPVTIAAASSAPKPAATQAAAEEKEDAAPAKPGGEGIKIHGHWKLVVHDSDGKLVSTRDFENSLVTPSGGDFVLSMLLAGQAVVADFAIALCPQAGAIGAFSVCTLASPNPVAVLVPSPNGTIESLLAANSLCGGGCVSGLNKQVTGSFGAPFGILLSGSYTSTQNVSINAVQTVMGFCQLSTTTPSLLNISPQTCDTLNNPTNITSGNAALTYSPFTGTALSTPQILSTGQILTVTVTLSFS